MPKDFSRTSRISEVLQREISLILQKEMRDPRLGILTILDVNVTKDLQIAKVYFSILEDEVKAIEQATGLLNEASGFLRTQLARRVKLRITPKLIFIYDDTLIKGNRIYKLLDDLAPGDTSSSNRDSDKE